MSEAKHTPGPWRVSYESGTTRIRTADNESIMCNETYYPWVPHNDADWHLIAAAPDLLDALERCLNFIANTESEMGETLPCGDQARTAITKAKGDQQ